MRRGEQKSQGTRLSLPKATSLELSLSPPPVFSFFPISPFRLFLSCYIDTQSCPPAGANASSSLNPHPPFKMLYIVTPRKRSFTSPKPVKSSSLTSAPTFSSFDHSITLLRLHLFHSAYAARMSFYRLRQFQCEVTGKSGLDYFQALESEQQEARTMHSRFPDPLKSAVLRAVQWRKDLFFLACLCILELISACDISLEVMGRLDHLVEAVYERFKDRYYPDESTFSSQL